MGAIYTKHNKIGGTLACVIAHKNHFGKTPYSEWLVLTGQKKPEDLSKKFPVQLGVISEDLNAEFFEYKSGLTVNRSEKARGLHFAKEDYLVCQPDGFVKDPVGENCLFEAKHSNHFSTMDIQLERYSPQLQHNMYVTGTKKAFLSVIFGNKEPVYVEIERDDEWLVDHYLPAVKQFWKHVKTQTPPLDGKPLEKNKIIIKGQLVIDRSHKLHNQFMAAEKSYLDTKPFFEKHNEAKESLKELAPDNIKTTIGELIEVRRNKNGSARIYEREEL